MAITVKDISGAEHQVPTNGKATAGLTTGIIGTALGGLLALGAADGNGLGLFGGGGSSNGVTKDQYYQERIQDIKENNAALNAIQMQLCALGERAAISETANAYQNRITEIGFANVDQRFDTERLITDYEITARTCDFIKSQKFLTPNMLAEPFVKTDRALDSHLVWPPYNPRGFGGYPSFNGGCACAG